MRSRRRRSGPRGGIDRDRVLEAAQSLLQDGGIDGVSIRAVARVLDVAPNAVYTYVASKAELLNDVADRGLALLDLDLLEGAGSPRDRLVAFATHARAVFLEHRGLLRILVDRPIFGPASLRLNERLLTTVVSAGQSPERAGATVYALTVFVYGWVQLEIGDDERVEPVRATRLDLDAYPLTAAAFAGGGTSAARQFEDAVAQLLSGFGL